MEAVNLDHTATLIAMVQNVGDVDTTLVDPSVEIGEQVVVGGIISRDGQPQPSGQLLASPAGPGVVVQFQLEGQAPTLGRLPLTLRLPHTPGQFIGTSVHVVQMKPAGQADGRHGWRQTDAEDVPQD